MLVDIPRLWASLTSPCVAGTDLQLCYRAELEYIVNSLKISLCCKSQTCINKISFISYPQIAFKVYSALIRALQSLTNLLVYHCGTHDNNNDAPTKADTTNDEALPPPSAYLNVTAAQQISSLICFHLEFIVLKSCRKNPFSLGTFEYL